MFIQVNDKGQLRLSRRALLPDADPESHGRKQHTGSTTRDSVASQKAPEKGSAKRVPKDGLAEENVEQPKDKPSTHKLSSSPKSTPADDALLPQKKFVRRFDTNKEVSKKSSNKAVGSVSSKDKTSLVNGEANIG